MEILPDMLIATLIFIIGILVIFIVLMILAFCELDTVSEKKKAVKIIIKRQYFRIPTEKTKAHDTLVNILSYLSIEPDLEKLEWQLDKVKEYLEWINHFEKDYYKEEIRRCMKSLEYGGLEVHKLKMIFRIYSLCLEIGDISTLQWDINNANRKIILDEIGETFEEKDWSQENMNAFVTKFIEKINPKRIENIKKDLSC